MGIPKFFRFISERWPMISQLIDGNQIPEFDNLYLDMNSILHTCTRPKDADVTKRLSEEEVFSTIFAYIDHLFDTIKPQQTFYMAIDGVAPRAKMNQQRARRFRTALDAEKNLKKAQEEGLDLPEQEPFDSNAITPGTEFMAKLTRYLKYFIHKKITTDSNWQNVEIILSGHEVPGEGEHKIMEFIRNKKADKNYNPNTRHCIYGLDADLIILGLVSHDPHFALLREEVVFGRRQTQPKSLEDQKFYLLHLSLVREYLELEFQSLKDEIKFEYDFERILDDFVLIMYVIGNDFLPNLPDLHLNKGAFPLLLETFKQALRTLDGYINESGKINLPRLGVWLDVLSKFELENFEKEDVDLEWFNKQLENISLSGEKKRERIGKLALLKKQRKLVGFIKPWLIKIYSSRFSTSNTDESIPSLALPTEFTENNIDFLKEFAFDLGLIITHSKSTGIYTVKIDIDGIDLHESDEEFNDRVADIRRLIKRYEAAVILDADGEEAVEERKDVYNEKFERWKDEYYKDKLGFSIKDEANMKEITENYIEGLQWVLFYYYRGVQSWPWYYRYHYAPRISDIKKGLQVIIDFNKGQPFKPFEQLMAVLPARSRLLVPQPYRALMTDEHSPIHDFYPSDVETDMNGKTAEWEAVVKLSFVDEDRLKAALAPFESQLTAEEKQRNSFGKDIVFTFNPQIDEVYKSPLPGIFADIEKNQCFETIYHLQIVDESELVTGLCDGVFLNENALAGFPSLKSIPFDDKLELAGVQIFNQPSRSNSMILTPKDIHEGLTVEQFANRYINKIVYTEYPYLREAKIVKICDGTTEFFSVKTTNGLKVSSGPIDPDNVKVYRSTVSNVKNYYSGTRGINIKSVRALVYVKTVTGLRRTNSGAFVKEFTKDEKFFPLELIVENVKHTDPRYVERAPLPINEEFPIESKVLFLGDYAYGGQATVTGYASTSRLNLDVLKLSTKAEFTAGSIAAHRERSTIKYFPSYEVAKKLRIQSLFLSKITSSFQILNDKNQRVNVGLDLKFDGRREKVIGYTKKVERGWLYSNHAISLIEEYRHLFPSFFKDLSTKNFGYGDVPSIRELWPKVDDLEIAKRLNDISDWLKHKKKDFAKASLESDSLSRGSIKEIESQIELFAALPDKQDSKKLIGVPKDAVLDPSVSYAKLKAQSFALGDRVVYVHDSGKVPLFSKGTVVGYHSAGSNVTLHVLFDKPLMGGNKLEGRLETNRGLVVDSSLVLNVTDRQFIYHSKASSNRKHPNESRSRRAAPPSSHTAAAAAKTAPVAPSTTNSTPVTKAQSAKAPSTAAPAKSAPQTKKESEPKPAPIKKKENELLSLLKGGVKLSESKDDADSESQSNGQKTNALRHIQASIIHEVHTLPSQQQPPQQPQQQFIQPNGFIAPGFVPQGGFIPFIPQDNTFPIGTQPNNSNGENNTRNNGNRGGRGGRGRGRGRGGNRGNSNRGKNPTKSNGNK